MSDSDLSGRLLAPVMVRPRRPLSNSASTASCSIRFSLRTMMSGARSSISRLRRLLRLITRRYRSFRSDVAKRPPSSGTSGRSSGGMTGTTSRIIHSGRLPESMKLSTTLRRLMIFLGLSSDLVVASSCNSASRSPTRSSCSSILRRKELVLGQQLEALERSHARLDHDIGFEIEHALELLQLHVEQQADARR